MDGYLFDTQMLTYWYDPADVRFPRVKAVADHLPADAPLYVSAITLGEISFGHAISPEGSGPKRTDFARFIRTKLFQSLEVSRHTAEPYGNVRAHLADRFAPKDGWTKKRRAEQMADPVTGLALGIDENDLWIVAQAIERRLVLVTADQMVRIREAVAELYPEFRIENWAAGP